MEPTGQRLVGRDKVGKRAKALLAFFQNPEVEGAICFSVTLLLLLWACVQFQDDRGFSKGYFQVEIAGVEASGFPGAQPNATSPVFNITARVVNRYKNEKVTLQLWEADVSYAGIPLGMGHFPEICLEKMSEKAVTATTSTGFVHLDTEIRRRMASGESESPGGRQLQIDMTLHYTVHRRYGRQRQSMQWLWCNATWDKQWGPSRCHIYEHTEPPSLIY